MMHEHDRSNGYGRHMQYGDDRHEGEYRSRDYQQDDRGHDDERSMYGDRDSRSGRYDEESMPFSRRETPRRLRGNTVASVWEITAQSRTSFDDAIRYGIERARRTLRHIRGAWVQGQEVLLRNNEIYAYRVQLKLTYVLDDT
jgi:flavin-binding protein dodecin